MVHFLPRVCGGGDGLDDRLQAGIGVGLCRGELSEDDLGRQLRCLRRGQSGDL